MFGPDGTTGGEPRSLTGGSPEATQVLELLGGADGAPLTIDELRDRGVTSPAQAVYELQLGGYEVDRVRRRGAGGELLAGYRLRRTRPTRR